MKFQAFLLSLFLGLAGASTGFAQDGAEAPEAAAPEAAAPEAEAPEAGTTDDTIDVDAVIAAYNAELQTARTFTAEEREWIGAGLAPESVDDAHKGYIPIPSGDPNVVIVNRNGERLEFISNADHNTPPVMNYQSDHMMPFAPEVDQGTFWMAEAASDTAKDVDAMFNFIMWINYIFTAIIGVLMVFCIKYRRRPGVRADQSITHNTPVEIVWSVIPAILCAIMFWGGYVTFLDLRTAPADAMKVNVMATRWNWTFSFQNGVESPHEVHVPENTPIELVMTSNDVLHSLHLPAYRAKSDVLPNRYTKVWFNSGGPGVYRIYCSEYCGKEHSNMYAKLVVEPKADFDAWMTKVGNWMVDENGELKPPLEIGELTYNRKGCKSCHTLDGTKSTGPTFAGLWGKTRKFDDGTEAVADENYISQSMQDPHSQIVLNDDGVTYGKQMTLYAEFPVEQVNGVIEFIKSLKDVK